jgi:hypothetical protein
MREAIPPLPQYASWRGAQLNKEAKRQLCLFTLYEKSLISMVNDFLLGHHFRVDFRIHPSFYLTGIRGSYPGGKATAA